MAPRLTLLERPAGVLGPITSESEVHFFCTGRDRWSIYDRRLDEASPDAFLGRLTRIAGIFEVVFADTSRPRAYCASLAAARVSSWARRAAHGRRYASSAERARSEAAPEA